MKNFFSAGSFIIFFTIILSGSTFTIKSYAEEPVYLHTFQVNSDQDLGDGKLNDAACETLPGNGVCTLRAAVEQANMLKEPTLILLEEEYYYLSLDHLTINSGSLVTIQGKGSNRTFINAASLKRVFNIADEKTVFNLESLTIQGGYLRNKGSGNGAGIYNFKSTVNIKDCSLQDNQARSLVDYYYDFNIHKYVLNDFEPHWGGGIYNDQGKINIEKTSFFDNSSATYPGPNVITQDQMIQMDKGGALYNHLGEVHINSSVFYSNRAGYYVTYNDDYYYDTYKDVGKGGAIFNDQGLIYITNSTFSENLAFHAGTIYTIGNQDTKVYIANSTLVAESYTLVEGTGEAGINIKNSILSNSTLLTDTKNSVCEGTLKSFGYNLISFAHPSVCVVAEDHDLVGSTVAVVNPVLDELSNSGSTKIHTLFTGSPAIDGGDPKGCKDWEGNLITADQRGFSRPTPQSGRCDIGAVEVVCGDGDKQALIEACDDGNQINGDGCDNNCTLTACGNGIMTKDEECDDGNNQDGDGCSHDCKAEIIETQPTTPQSPDPTPTINHYDPMGSGCSLYKAQQPFNALGMILISAFLLMPFVVKRFTLNSIHNLKHSKFKKRSF